MNLRVVTCSRCGHEWATRVKPKRCASCRTPYWRKSRGDEPPEVIQRHPTLTNRELAAVLAAAREEGWYREPVQDWEIECSRGDLSPEELERYQHGQEVLATYDRMERETRERKARHPSAGPGPSMAELLSPGPDPRPASDLGAQRNKAAQLLADQTGIIL